MAAFTLKIKLQDIEPEIFRIVVVSSESSFYLLHHIIQEAMGWKNYHLYHFTAGNTNIGDLRLLLTNGYDEMEMNPVEGKDVMLEEYLTETGQRIGYVYDYGDHWEHQIELIGIGHDPQHLVLPLLVNGKNACPPEDCGGIDGYTELKNILSDVRHEEYASMVEWAGAGFNPEKFNRKTAIKNLAKLNEKIAYYEKGFSER
jgi:hypothetical protein